MSNAWMGKVAVLMGGPSAEREVSLMSGTAVVSALRDRGVEMIERETLDSALMSGRSVLESMGWSADHARDLATRFERSARLNATELIYAS